MKYEQLERCYKTVLAQRDKAEVDVINLQHALDDALIELDAFKKDKNWTRSYNYRGELLNADLSEIKMSNEVEIEIRETHTYQITVDLDLYHDDVTKAYKEKDAFFFSDWKDDAKSVEIEFDWD